MLQKGNPYLYVLPAVLFILIFFFGGLFQGLLQSFGITPYNKDLVFTTLAYQELLQSADFWQSLLLTFRVSFLSTMLSGLLGILFAFILFIMALKGYDSNTASLFYRIFQYPLVIPHLAAGYLFLLLLMQSGWISRIGYHFGWVEEIHHFPILVNDTFGWGMILTYTWKEAPFITLMIYPVLFRIHKSWYEVARLYGSNTRKFISNIAVPLILPAWLSSLFIVFAFTFSAFEIPYLLGVTYPRLLPVYSFELFTHGGWMERSQSLALNIILAFITAILGGLSYKISKRWLLNERRGWE
ncbi:ABC transporter permease [Chengkuizengella axinellae]|uniref:Sugar ABC transporter permease n=1 Tax=Chengkuizengella axinellae TaxID=3064388 RepID=A0ABT9J2H6_9BACL|nr:sugar ABC transporter permease [Chengkuizengella sp. 2205SS18-9]MDP5275795.1 sugar ABC transporter permease [Chengkuizengella sp. 2205SS18-9]